MRRVLVLPALLACLLATTLTASLALATPGRAEAAVQCASGERNFYPSSVWTQWRFGIVKARFLACNNQPPTAWSLDESHDVNGTGSRTGMKIKAWISYGGVGGTARHWYLNIQLDQCIAELCKRAATWKREFYAHKVGNKVSMHVYNRGGTPVDKSGYVLHTTP